MRWIASFLILISIAGYLCDDEEESCFKREWRKCLERTQPPTEFPQTPEELLAACRASISMGNCILEAIEGCDGEKPDLSFTHRHQRVNDYMKDTCQEDNPTFKAISKNLPCVERVAKSPRNRCRNLFSRQTVKAIDRHVELLLDGDNESELAGCLFDSMRVVCEGAIFAYHCGEEVKDAVQEIEAHVNSPRSLDCSAEQVEDVSSFLRVYEGFIVEGLELRKMNTA